MIASCFLSFIDDGFDHPLEALDYVCRVAGVDPDESLLPSHEWYISYFGYVQCGYVPEKKILHLEWIIMNGIPDIETTFIRNLKEADEDSEENRLWRSSCQPYI